MAARTRVRCWFSKKNLYSEKSSTNLQQPPQSLQASPNTKMDVINVTILHRFWCCFQRFNPAAFRFVALSFWALYSWMRRSVKGFITGIPSYLLSNRSFLSNQCWIATWIAASLLRASQARIVSMTITLALDGCGTSTENSQAHPPDGSCHGPVNFWIHPRPEVFSTSFKTFVRRGMPWHKGNDKAIANNASSQYWWILITYVPL